MRIALDTNAYRAHVEKNPTLIDLAHSSELVAVPIVVLGELRFGYMSGTRLAQNERVLERFLMAPRVRVLDITTDTTRLFGELGVTLRRAGRSLNQNDIWIAALCKQYECALVTRDRDFGAVIGLQVLNF